MIKTLQTLYRHEHVPAYDHRIQEGEVELSPLSRLAVCSTALAY